MIKSTKTHGKANYYRIPFFGITTLQARGKYFESMEQYQKIVTDYDNSAKYYQMVVDRDLAGSHYLASEVKSLMAN